MTILPAVVLLLFALILYLVAQTWPKFNYYWLIAVGGALLSWLLVIGLRFILPLPVDLQPWTVTGILQPELVLSWDPFTWRYSLAVSTLALAFILTEVIRAPEGDWQSWAAGFLLSGVGVLAIQAGNMFTLFLGFTALDVISGGLGLLDSEGAAARFRSLAARLAGTGLILLTGLLIPVDFIGPGGSVLSMLFFLGCGLRLVESGPQPVHLPRGIGVLSELVPAVAGLTAIFRLAPHIAAGADTQAMLGIVALSAGLAAGLRWAGHNNLVAARPYWVLGSAAVFAAAVLLGLPDPAMAWGLGLIFAGGVLFLHRLQAPWQIAIPAVSLWTVSALPFSPLAPGQAVFQTSSPLWVYLVLPVHGLLLAGYLRRISKEPPEEQDNERWVLVIFPTGLVLLCVTFIGVSLIPWQGMAFVRQAAVWPGFVVGVLGVAFWWIYRRIDLGNQIESGLNFVLDFIYLGTRPVLGLIRAVSGVMNNLSLILEGQGGILWAILLIVLILSLVTQVDLGGFVLGN